MYLLVVHSPGVQAKFRYDPTPRDEVDQIIDACKVFGPYASAYHASQAGKTVDERQYSWSVIPLIHLSEALDNPGGHLFWGNAPD